MTLKVKTNNKIKNKEKLITKSLKQRMMLNFSKSFNF